MAWTDITTQDPNSWTLARTITVHEAFIDTGDLSELTQMFSATTSSFISTISVPRLSGFNIPGYDDGYQPASTPDPINNDFNEGGGGGGSTRPTSGFLYPRGQG